MSIKCPNKSHPDWKAIENKYGEDAAWTAYILAGEEIPSLADASYVISNKVREGSFEVFNSSSELSKIGNLIEYNQYLDTIFPDSEVKDIVYHGTKSKESFEEYKTSEKKFKNGDNRVGFYFTKEKRYAEEFGRVIPNIINTINPIKINEEVNFGEIRKYQGKNDAVIGIDDASEILVGEKIESYVVFEPEQIHILGSKQDIGGFKEFISSEKIVEKQESFDGSSINKSPEQFSIGKSPKIKYQKASLEESVEKNNFEIIKTLKTAILTQLEAMGVGVGVLDYYEGINGVFDPQGAKDTTTGLINLIRVAKGEVGDAAIPEEFAHFVDAVLRQQNSPIFKRLTDLLTNEEIVKEIFERDEKGSYDLYNRLYGGNMALMAAEARAKLIARHIIKNEEIKQSPWSSLMNRVKDFFKRIFSKADANSLENTLERIDKTYSKFALELMGNKIDLNFNLDNMRNERFMYNAHNNLNDAEKVFTQVVELRAKQFKIGEKRYSKEEKSRQENILSDLEAFKAQSRNIEGILAGVNFALEDFDRVRNLTKEFKANMDGSKQSVANFAKHLRELKSYTNAYTPLAKAIDAYMLSDEYINTPIVNLDSVMRDLKDILGKAEQEYLSNAMPLFRNFIKQFSGKLIGSVIRGEVFTEEMFDRLLIESNRDIGLAEKLLYSMSNTSELMLRLIERPVKEANRKKMDEANELVMDMQFAQEKLEKAGFKTDFLYEFDSKGIPTGFWISDVDWAKYRAEEEKKKTELNNKYGNPNNDRNPRASLWKKEYMQWKQENTEPDGNTPKKSIYTPENFNKLAPAQKEFYYTILEVKKQMMSHLPEYEQNLLLAPQYRKDFLDILRESKNMKDAVKRYKTLIGDQFIDRESDDVYGAKNRLKNFDDTKLETLPIYYTRPLSDPAQLSLDVVSTMALYVDMALGYKYMNEIVDIMELGRDLMKERKIQDTRGGKPLQEIIESAGRTISSKIIKPTGSTNFMDRLNEFYSNQIYGVSQKDEGIIKIPFTNTHLSIAKSANQLNKYTAMNTYAFNFLGGVANILTGKAMTRIEAMAGEYLGIKESAKADRIYAKWLPDIISDLGRRRDTTLPSLLFRKFNTFQDYEQSLREIRQNKKNLIGRYFTGSTAFFINNAGEHYLAAKIFLGMAQRYLLKDSSGNEVPLYEAFEVVKNDKGREVLQLKAGITKLDGNEFTADDMHKFSWKVSKVHQNMHGIYNKEDMSMIQSTAIGRLGFMFRKWMPPAWHRRFDPENFDFDLNEVDKGYYRSFGSFLTTLYSDLKQGQINIAANWKNMTPKERANIKRALTEIGSFLATVGAFMLLSGAWKDDDEWWKSFVLYQIRRQQTELGVMTPLIITQFQEGLTILKSPAAAVNYSEHLVNILRVWDIWQPPLQSGPYEGWNRYARDLVRPLPYHNAIRRAVNPKEPLKFLENN